MKKEVESKSGVYIFGSFFIVLGSIEHLIRRLELYQSTNVRTK